MAIERHQVYRGRYVKAEFKLDRGGFKQIALGPKLKSAVHEVVERHAMPIAKTLSADFTNSGTYINSFHVEDDTVVAPREWPMRRVAARLVNNAQHPGDKKSYAATVEVGDGEHFHGHHVLARTLDQLVALGLVTMSEKARAALTHVRIRR